MKHFDKATLAFILLLALSGAPIHAGKAGSAADPQSGRLTGPQLVEALKKGGYVVYFRHAKTDRTQIDSVHTDLDDCRKQRNLSAEGRRQADAIGKALRATHVPVGRVYSSPYCRCKDTASLTLGNDYTVLGDLQFAINAPPAERERRVETLNALLGTVPENGQNTFIVSHTGNLKEAMNIWPKPEGVMVVFKPSADDAPAYVGMILPEDWPATASVAEAD